MEYQPTTSKSKKKMQPKDQMNCFLPGFKHLVIDGHHVSSKSLDEEDTMTRMETTSERVSQSGMEEETSAASQLTTTLWFSAKSETLSKPELNGSHIEADVGSGVRNGAITMESLLAEVDKLDAECKFDKALFLMETHPMFVRLGIRKSKLLVKLGRDEEAHKILSRLVSKDDKNIEALLAFGFFLASKRRYREAENYFREVLNLSMENDPSWKKAQKGLFFLKNSWDKGYFRHWALKAKARCHFLSRNRSFFFQGKAAHHRGWHAKALGCFEQAMLNGGYRDDVTRWAFCCLALGRFEEALNFFKNRPAKFDSVVPMVEEIEEMCEGQCPYGVLRVRIGSSLKDITSAFDRRMKEVLSPAERSRIIKGFLLLTDYEFRTEYEARHLEVDYCLFN